MNETLADPYGPPSEISLHVAQSPRARMTTLLAALDVYDVAIMLGMSAVILLVCLTFRSYAVSNDEIVQHHYGQLIFDYYRSAMTDHSVFHYENLYLYGGLFDIAAVLLAKIIHIDVYDLRHIMCAMIGVAGIGAAAATARLIAGSRAGLLAGASLALCGAWYGSMFNHTKDVPFAAAMVGSLYFLIRISRDLPKPRLVHVLAFGLLAGTALGIRVLGLLLVFYAGFAILLCTPRPFTGHLGARAGFILRSGVMLIPAFVLAYLIMIAAWPWAALSPLNPIHGLFDFSGFQYHIKTLFDGHVYEMATVPRLYVPIYLLIRIPLMTLAGAALALALVAASRRIGGAVFTGLRRTEIALVALTVAFPLLCQVGCHGPAFTGMRHFTFVVPSIAILAGIGLHLAISCFGRFHRIAAVAAVLVITALSCKNLMTLVELHPYEYLAYNETVGGLKGASGRYDTDYWVSIMPDAVTDLEKYIARTEHVDARHPARSYTVAVCGERGAFEDRPHQGLHWIPSEDWKSADFFIAPTHMSCDQILGGKDIADIRRLDTTIGVVKDRRALTRPSIASAF